jgi:hypothetical protein
MYVGRHVDVHSLQLSVYRCGPGIECRGGFICGNDSIPQVLGPRGLIPLYDSHEHLQSHIILEPHEGTFVVREV